MQIFTREEIRDIIVAILGITLIFSFRPFPIFGIDFEHLHWYLLAVILAFLLHEILHKITAMKFNCAAFYKLWPQGLLFGLIFMLLGVKFVAPGAVVIYPFRFGRWGFRRIHLTQTEMGLIALAGLSVNLFFAVFFRLFPGELAYFLSFVNSWLFFFNLLPIPPLDGTKILSWKFNIWVFLFVISILLIVPYFI